MIKSLSILEYQPINFRIIESGEEGFINQEKTLFIYEKTLEKLEDLNERNKNKIVKFTNRKIIFQNYVGALKIGDLSIEILPKFLAPRDLEDFDDYNEDAYRLKKEVVVRNLFFMLQFTPELNFINIDFAHIDYAEGFYETIIKIFAKKLLNLLKNKQFKEYLYKTAELNYIREKIDVNKHLVNLTKLHKIPCIFHERSMNSLINRIFKFTLKIMLSVVDNDETYKILKRIDSILYDVDYQPISIDEIRRIKYNRLNSEFKPFIDFCYQFLKNCTISMNSSKFEFFSFLFPMELLFERFIGNFLSCNYLELLPEKERILPKIQPIIGHLVHKNSVELFKLNPDVSLGDENKLIIDTKYKILKRPKVKKYKNYDVKPSDLYQMYAYCKESGAKKCLLLYPESYEGKINNLNWKLGISKDIDLFIRTIKLSYDFSIDKDLKEFKDELRDILSDLF